MANRAHDRLGAAGKGKGQGAPAGDIVVHLLDGTYELFRHHFGQPSRRAADGSEIAATRGVLLTVLSMFEDGVTHLGVATDHVIESFRNSLWPGYKTSQGVPPELLGQFPVLERCLEGLGVTLWAMTDLEADDGLASAAAVAAEDRRVRQVRIWTPDKDLAQCVQLGRVVQVERRTGTVIDEQGVWAKFGVGPSSIPDWLALVGDTADGYPGLPGWGKRSAAQVLAHYGAIEAVPDAVGDWDPGVVRQVRNAGGLAATLAAGRELAMLFRDLATLRVERTLLGSVDDLRWPGPTEAFGEMAELLRDPRLAERADAAARRGASRRRGGS
jgi:5'-3' exonuclease